MRIAYFLADHGIPVFGDKGASVHVRAIVDAFLELGHEVTIFCTKEGTPPEQGGYQIVKVVGAAEAVPADIDESDPLAHRRAKERRYMASAGAMERAFSSAHEEQAFDFIYERYSLWSAAAINCAERYRIPSIIEVNSPLLEEQKKYRVLANANEASEIENKVFRHAGLILAVSEAVADYVSRRGGRSTRIVVMSNAVDERRFHPRVRPVPLGYAKGKCIIGFCGTLKEWHGVDILMDGFRELNKRHAGVHLLIMGDGPMRHWLEGYIQGADLAGKVTLSGWVNHDGIPAMLARCDILVAPYPDLDDFYFSPLKLFEYLALGKSVVASDIGQIGDIIEHGQTGLLAKAGDSLALADALERLIIDSSLRQHLGNNAAVYASRYTWKSNAQRVLDLANGLKIDIEDQSR